MRYPAGEKQHWRRVAKVGGVERLIGKKVPRVVERHKQHDYTAQQVYGVEANTLYSCFGGHGLLHRTVENLRRKITDFQGIAPVLVVIQQENTLFFEARS